jgi:cytochrome d ubiquinol oxidase subunit II
VHWRSAWDYALFVSGFVPSLVFGVAVGNTLEGVPFYFDDNLRSFYTGTFWALLNPFALLCGVLSVCMLAMHGAFFINVKTNGILQRRAQMAAQYMAMVVVILFVLGGVWVSQWLDGYQIIGTIAHDGPSNPLYKKAIQKSGAWLCNFQNNPLTISVPLLGILAPILAILFKKKAKLAFTCSALTIMGIIATVGISMFPFILPSSTNPSHSLLVWDSSSSQLTLSIMLFATVFFLPIILMYTAWVYRVLRGKVTEETILDNQDIGY